MNKLIELQISNECVDVEYEIITPIPLHQENDVRKEIDINLQSVEYCLEKNNILVNELNAQIDKLTNHADGIDNMVAVGSGIFTGLIDSFFVGEFSLLEGREWSSEKVNKFVINFAQKKGYKNNGGDLLNGSINFLENNFKLNSDKAAGAFGGSNWHHLQDFTHHPTIFGFIFSIIAQCTGNVFGADIKGGIKIVKVLKQNAIDDSINGGASFKNIGDNVFGKWFGHIISDIAGSSNNRHRLGEEGMGVPGPLVSTFKELSTIFNKFLPKNSSERSKCSEYLSEKFSEGFDFRSELGLYQQIGKQALPVVINEIIVRGFYAIRRLVMEIKSINVSSFADLKKINWNNIIPNGNRTITRMLTIATGTFMAVDMADAAFKSGFKSAGNPALFLTNFVLHVNFVGVGRFAIAAVADVRMSQNQTKLRNERIAIYGEQLHLYSAKVYYKEAQMWIEAKEAALAIDTMQSDAEKCVDYFNESMGEIKENAVKISESIDKLDKNNPMLLKEISGILSL
ncbi:MAG: hypothetical protein SNG38_08435 [Rikenellaceae bacterium]